MSEPGFMDNVRSRGTQLRDALSELKEHHPALRQVRGPGLMVATELRGSGARARLLLEHCLREGRLILMNAGTHGNIVRWMPPLVVTAAEIDEAVGAFAAALEGDGLSAACPASTTTRLLAWRELQSVVAEIHRGIDDDLRREWAVPLGSFEVLAALRDLGGRARPQDVAARDAASRLRA